MRSIEFRVGEPAAARCKAVLEFGSNPWSACPAGPVASDLSEQRVHVGVGAEAENLESVREVGNHVEGAGADRTRRAKDDDPARAAR